jgi:hypothetical protein
MIRRPPLAGAALLALLALLAATALPAQVTFYPCSPQVSSLERLYRLAGLAFPVEGFPVSARSLSRYAGQLDAQLHDPLLAASLDSWRQALDYHPRALEIEVQACFSLEGYLRAGSPWEDFTHEYLEREPLGELTLSWSRKDKAAVVVQAFLVRQYDGIADWNLPGSSPGNPVALENREVTKGYFWYNFEPLQLELGRDVVHFGPLRSSLLPSDRLPFMDVLRLTLPLGRLTMDFMISSLENSRAEEDISYDQLALQSPGFSFAEDDPKLYPGVTVILANMHRFEYDFGFLRAAVTGLCVYAREDNAFVLGDFFPVFSWHSSDIKPNNLSLIFDLDAVLFPGFRVMAQFGFDDISTAGIGVGDSPTPTIYAGIVGAQYSRPLTFAGLDLYIEAGYTHYLWGSFNDEWYLGRAIYRLELDHGTHALPLTSPYGPGTAWGSFQAALEDWKGFTTRLCVELVFRNPRANLTTLPYAADSEVASTPLEGTLRVSGELCWDRLGWLAAYAKPSFFYRDSGGWFELVLGCTAGLDWRHPVR